MSVVTLSLKAVSHAPVQVKVAIPPENPKITGYFTANFIVKSKDEHKEIGERIKDEVLDDEGLIREVCAGFDGLGDEDGKALTGDEAFNAVLHGPLSAYLAQAVIKAYYEHYGDALKGNSKRSRGR